MSFAESDRVNIRKYLGLTSLYRRSYTRFEDAMTLIQSVADGGSMVDSSTETMIKASLTELAAIETGLKALRIQAHVQSAGADQLKINALQGAFFLKGEGRRQIAIIANTLGIEPSGDFFSGTIDIHGSDASWV
jgi:hypothetical protein